MCIVISTLLFCLEEFVYFGFKSVNGILTLSGAIIKSDLATKPVILFLLITIWLGIQQTRISVKLDTESNRPRR